MQFKLPKNIQCAIEGEYDIITFNPQDDYGSMSFRKDGIWVFDIFILAKYSNPDEGLSIVFGRHIRMEEEDLHIGDLRLILNCTTYKASIMIKMLVKLGVDTKEMESKYNFAASAHQKLEWKREMRDSLNAA